MQKRELDLIVATGFSAEIYICLVIRNTDTTKATLHMEQNNICVCFPRLLNKFQLQAIPPHDSPYIYDKLYFQRYQNINNTFPPSSISFTRLQSASFMLSPIFCLDATDERLITKIVKMTVKA